MGRKEGREKDFHDTRQQDRIKKSRKTLNGRGESNCSKIWQIWGGVRRFEIVPGSMGGGNKALFFSDQKNSKVFLGIFKKPPT